MSSPGPMSSPAGVKSFAGSCDTTTAEDTRGVDINHHSPTKTVTLLHFHTQHKSRPVSKIRGQGPTGNNQTAKPVAVRLAVWLVSCGVTSSIR